MSVEVTIRLDTSPQAALLLKEVTLYNVSTAELEIESMRWGNDTSLEKGEIYTKECIVSFILDLVGYTASQDLLKLKLLEPSFGMGDFLLPAIERLLKAVGLPATKHQLNLEALAGCITAYELNSISFRRTSLKVESLLKQYGISTADRNTLMRNWLHQGDFLLSQLRSEYTHVVGNPPYVRQELVPERLMSEYRNRFHTIYDRADLYIPFYEHSLAALVDNGALGFICSDRWIKNRYGRKLRGYVASGFHLKYYIDMYDVEAFQSDVSAYTAITIMTKGKDELTKVVHSSDIHLDKLHDLVVALKSNTPCFPVKLMNKVVQGDSPWLLQSDKINALVTKIEGRYPALEEAGCKVSIGVATGNNKVFVVKGTADIEPSRLLPVVKAEDIATGAIRWPGDYVINPFDDEGQKLVNLQTYPKLQKYFSQHKEKLSSRHVSQKNPTAWYRTIDKIHARKAALPKLLIPDIKSDPTIVYDSGKYYPNNSLYYITSTDWNLLALRAVLLSGIARLFLMTYSTKIGSGYIRYQAQYLRRIRIPMWSDVPPKIRKKLTEAGAKDASEIASAVYELYDLSEDEIDVIENMEA